MKKQHFAGPREAVAHLVREYQHAQMTRGDFVRVVYDTYGIAIADKLMRALIAREKHV